jgi:hypothetical protein
MSDVHGKIPIWRTVVAAYRLGIGAVFSNGALFRYFIYASLLSLVILALQFFLTASRLAAMTQPQAPGTTVLSIAASMLLYVAYAAALCPFAAAVHRRILLGETPRGYYAAAWRTQRQFLLATIAVYALFFLAPLVSNLAAYLIFGLNPLDPLEMSRAYQARPGLAAVMLLLSFVTYLVAGLIATRFTFAFPSIAIERPGASLRHAFAETRGSTGRLFLIFLITFAVPFAILIILYAGAAVIFAISHPELLRAPERMGSAMLYSTPVLVAYALMFVLTMIMVAVTAAAAARAYEIRVGGMIGVAEVFS